MAIGAWTGQPSTRVELVILCAGRDLAPLAEPLRESVLPALLDWGRARHLALRLYVRWPDGIMTVLDQNQIHVPVARPTEIFDEISGNVHSFFFALIGRDLTSIDEAQIVRTAVERSAETERLRYLFVLAEHDADRATSSPRHLFDYLQLRGRHAYASPDLPNPASLSVALTRWLDEGLTAPVRPVTGSRPSAGPRSAATAASPPTLATPPGLSASAAQPTLPPVVEPLPSSTPPPISKTIVDENVQFTVYRPNAVQPEVWYPLLAFAHLAERRPGARPDQPDPLDQVKALAEQSLGDQVRDWGAPRSDARGGVPQGGLLTLVPYIDGVEFNPGSASFEWHEDVHQQNFRLRARRAMSHTVCRGQLTVYLGAFILADVDLAFRVDEAAPGPPDPARQPRRLLEARVPARPPDDIMGSATASPYRKIFPSYSHKDLAIVRQAEAYSRALGDLYLRDRLALRSGEQWNVRLLELIEEADVFQLFWSHNSMTSEYVRQEWEHALRLGRKNFIRPTYWEVPMPKSINPKLPPKDLAELHFHGFTETSTEVLPTTSRQEPSSDVMAVERASPPGPPPQATAQRPEKSARARRSAYWLIGCAVLLVVVTTIILIAVLGSRT